MLPNVLPNSASDHTPVLADEVREPPRRAAGRDGRRRHVRRRRPRAPARRRTSQGSGKLVAIDRDPSVKPHFDRFKAQAGVDVRFLRGDFAIVLTPARGERRQGRRDPARHRRLVDADRPARARLLVRDRRAARHADGSVRRDHGRDDRQHLGRARARDDLPPLRRGALRGADRPRDRAAPRRARVLPHRRPRRRDQDGDPDAGPLRRGASGQARLPGAPDRRQRRARRSSRPRSRPPSRCCGPAAASP